MINDPINEAVFEDLDEDDKKEFREIADVIKAKKIKQASQAWKHSNLLRRVANSAKAAAKPQPAPKPKAAPKAAVAAAPATRGPRVNPDEHWESVHCRTCHRLAGHVYLRSNPGHRDPATWFTRPWDPSEGKWADKGSYKTSKRVRCGGTREWAIAWIHERQPRGCPA